MSVRVTKMSSPLSALGWRFYTHDWSPTFELDPHGEIVAIDVEGDFDIFAVKVQTGWIMEPLDLDA